MKTKPSKARIESLKRGAKRRWSRPGYREEYKRTAGKKISKELVERWSDDEYKSRVSKSISIAQKKSCNTPEHFIIRSRVSKELWKDEEYRSRAISGMRQAALERWQKPDYRNKVITAQLKGLFKRPTSLEKQMINIIRRNNLPYRYTGDGDVLIGYKNPDFVNTEGEKICVEVANTYHHTEEYPAERIAHFKKYGWKCIVFRTDKLNEDLVLSRVGDEN